MFGSASSAIHNILERLQITPGQHLWHQDTKCPRFITHFIHTAQDKPFDFQLLEKCEHVHIGTPMRLLRNLFYTSLLLLAVTRVQADGDHKDGDDDDDGDKKSSETTTTSNTTTTDCSVDRQVELFLLQDVTGSFYSVLPATIAALPDFVQKIMDKYPGTKVGVSGFGDKNSPSGYLQGSDCWTDGSPLSSSISDFNAGLENMDILCCNGGNTPEDPFEAACYAAGTFAGFTPYSGDASDPVMRFIVVITDAEANYGSDSDPEIPGLESKLDCTLTNYAPKSQLMECLHSRGINLLAIVDKYVVNAWEKMLPNFGYNSTNSAVQGMTFADLEMDSSGKLSNSEAQKFIDTVFEGIDKTLSKVTCEIVESSPPVKTDTASTEATEATQHIDTGDDVIDCCSYCME
eukprot:Blabericola_migrator_1__6342@NODE_319_length_9881_cov_31_716324_g77_i1_p3_GENE_NODE_319_length_9881_cov_31_716324_g77_i1NODE_319_length_9881_cov_31_716324_g77_i1_p3_ORF_typecomplete_len404_score76_60Integrin_beta/PF00362_18/3_4e07VWA/PF00092_28/0_0024VWA/PF00092_28/2_7e03VWA_2/PF13519_6/0_025CYLD_phos_site/PF16607_5/9_5e03CYLD_phos_site/PF16607_5/0_13ElongfactP_C/PF09285_11/0_29_NODE_319_length_9881_cov_31_716324_g77_i175688779